MRDSKKEAQGKPYHVRVVEAVIPWRELNETGGKNLDTLKLDLFDVLYLPEAYAIAEKGFKKAVELNPENPIAHYMLGIFYEFDREGTPFPVAEKRNVRVDDAIKEYKKAIELAPDFIEAHIRLAVLLDDLDMKKELEEEYKVLMKLDSNYQDKIKKVYRFK